MTTIGHFGLLIGLTLGTLFKWAGWKTKQRWEGSRDGEVGRRRPGGATGSHGQLAEASPESRCGPPFSNLRVWGERRAR